MAFCVWRGCCCCVQVIMLSYFNVKKAMDYYASKGGTSKFIVCDDGFQVQQQAQQTGSHTESNHSARQGPCIELCSRHVQLCSTWTNDQLLPMPLPRHAAAVPA